MRIYWKALLGYGFVFWVLLCVTDFFGITNVYKYSKDLDELYDKPVVVQRLEEQLEPHLRKFEYKGIKFGWSLLVWNTVTFIVSFIICTVGQTLAWMVMGVYKKYRNRTLISQTNSQYAKVVPTLSRIPVMVKSAIRSSDTNLQSSNTKSKLDVEKSCPNLFMRRSGSSLSAATDITTKTCRTLFRKDIYLCNEPSLSAEQQLEKQCKKLREELHRVQTTSLKEHAVLSRKLECVTREKREIARQLGISQKENRAAKQQLEELLQEKALLLKKLENATKEFKCNTKTKKFALAKLEEVTNNVEELRQQLEQVSRDKEILEKKLRLLEVEYNKLHERYIISSQQKFFTNLTSSCSTNENMPERDENSGKGKSTYLDQLHFGDMDSNSIPPAIQQTADVLASVSQTEVDMKKIQEKIKQLEKNLENLNMSNNDYGYNELEHMESELSLSALEPTTDSQHRIDGGSRTSLSGYSSGNSPRRKYWSEKVAELIGRNKHQFAKIQEMAIHMKDKANFLSNIQDDAGSTIDLETTDSEEHEPKRLVSSSVAFKNFLKSLNNLDAAKKQIPTRSEPYF